MPNYGSPITRVISNLKRKHDPCVYLRPSFSLWKSARAQLLLVSFPPLTYLCSQSTKKRIITVETYFVYEQNNSLFTGREKQTDAPKRREENYHWKKRTESGEKSTKRKRAQRKKSKWPGQKKSLSSLPFARLTISLLVRWIFFYQERKQKIQAKGFGVVWAGVCMLTQ